MCAVEQDEARRLPEIKDELVYHIMNVDEMESEEFPMSPEIIAREQKKDTHLKEVMKKSDEFSERLVERSTVITYDNKIYIPMLIPQVRPAHKYPNSSWETIRPPGGDSAKCVYPHKVYMAECDKSLTATYQCKTPIPSNKLLVTNILTNN
jgi:hypothetical protein